ncbi:MAG TPA: hypothetical protein VK003_09600 [Oceanobacillus sp.]|jgi:hypothetical protein|nr:hypothetical protein [Oceanobacillus sp.]
MEINTTKVFRVLDAQAGTIQDVTPQPKSMQLDESLIPYPRDRKGRITVDHENVELAEAGAQLSTYNFPDALRMGLQVDLFTSYNEQPVTYPQFCRVVNSSKQQEEYLFDSAVGLPPIVGEGQPYPEVATDFDSGLIIRNHKRGFIMSVTEEMQKFDQVGKVREMPELMGRALRRGEEQSVMDVITTTGNYNRNSTTNDNDIGANTAATTFDAAGLILAFATLTTMKDRRTGLYLGVRPDTLIVTPRLWWAARQLIGSNITMRAHGATTAEVYGTGTENSFFNVVSTIIVSPELGASYQWWLGERGRAVTFQRVEPITLLTEGMNAQTGGYFERDVLRYRARNWYGVGMRDDRFAYFSSSTTPPTVA